MLQKKTLLGEVACADTDTMSTGTEGVAAEVVAAEVVTAEERPCKRVKTNTLPAHLKKHLRDANIVDSDCHEIDAKIQERTAGQLLSYLHLVLMKTQDEEIGVQQFAQQLEAHSNRASYTAFVQERTACLMQTFA